MLELRMFQQLNFINVKKILHQVPKRANKILLEFCHSRKKEVNKEHLADIQSRDKSFQSSEDNVSKKNVVGQFHSNMLYHKCDDRVSCSTKYVKPREMPLHPFQIWKNWEIREV